MSEKKTVTPAKGGKVTRAYRKPEVHKVGSAVELVRASSYGKKYDYKYYRYRYC